MVVNGVRRPLRCRGTNRQTPNRITFPLPTHLWRRVTRRILENSVRFNDSGRALSDESEDRRLELMVGTAPFSQIRANPMAWALFMRGYEVGRHFTQTTASNLQQDQEPDLRESPFEALRPNQMLGESMPSMAREAEGGPVLQAIEVNTPAEMLLPEVSAGEVMTLSADDALSPWLENVLALMDGSSALQFISTEAEPRTEAHVPSVNEDSTSTDYNVLLDDDDLEP